jgi:hypothetical protein
MQLRKIQISLNGPNIHIKHVIQIKCVLLAMFDHHPFHALNKMDFVDILSLPSIKLHSLL